MIDWKTKSSYDILEEFSKISSYSSFDKYAPTWTPRLNKILEILNSSNISHEIKHFKVPGFERDFTNIYVFEYYIFLQVHISSPSRHFK